VESEPSKVGKRGTVVIPAALRRRYGIKEGAMVIAEAREDGVLIRPAVILPVEVYTPERKAQFLLSTAVDREDYEDAVRAVRAMGLDPARILHERASAEAERKSAAAGIDADCRDVPLYGRGNRREDADQDEPQLEGF